MLGNDSRVNILKALHDLPSINKTYSRIVRVNLSEDREDMDSKTWVVLESQKFNTLHFIVLCDILAVPGGKKGNGGSS